MRYCLFLDSLENLPKIVKKFSWKPPGWWYMSTSVYPKGEGSSCKIEYLSLDLEWALQSYSCEQMFNYIGKIDIFYKGLNHISTIFKKSLDEQSWNKRQEASCQHNTEVHKLFNSQNKADPSHCVLPLFLTQEKMSEAKTFFPTLYDANQLRIRQENHLLMGFPLSFQLISTDRAVLLGRLTCTG